jgi:hypothetical protein
MPTPPRKPAPRTLSHTPPAQQRTPKAAHYSAKFPSLLMLLAGDALLEGCSEPTCAPTRSEELEQHGQESVRRLNSGNASEALRQIGIAMGVVSHPQTMVPSVAMGGAPPPATPVPQVNVPEPPSRVTGGVAVPVGREPAQPPVPPRNQTTTTRHPPGHPVRPTHPPPMHTAGVPRRTTDSW